MRPALSVLLLTTLIGAGQGLLLAVFLLDLLARNPVKAFVATCCMVSFALLGAGLVASFFHLGRPERAWRTATMWRTSWLSREVIVLPAFMGAVALYGYTGSLAAGAIAAVLCVALFVCTAMIYACLKFLQEWHSPLTLVNYFMLGTASGCLLAALLASLHAPRYAGVLAICALFLGAAAYLCRYAALRRNAAIHPKSTAASAIGVKSSRIVQKAQGFMGGSFNTREFFHGRPEYVVTAVRAAFLVLLFPAPAIVISMVGHTPQALAAAFALQYLGLLAERWHFFAEARHPQNIYYQAMA